MEQLATPPLPVGLQNGELNVPEPDGLSRNVMAAVGVTFVPALVSDTVAVHVVTVFTSSSAESHVIEVEVVLCVAVRLNVLELEV